MYINYQSKHTCVYETVRTHACVHAAARICVHLCSFRYFPLIFLFISVLPHMARFANFSDFVLGFPCRAVPEDAVCVLFARLPKVHEPVWSRVSQGSFNAFFSRKSVQIRGTGVASNDSELWDHTTARVATTPLG